jgi:hypothetical protein
MLLFQWFSLIFCKLSIFLRGIENQFRYICGTNDAGYSAQFAPLDCRDDLELFSVLYLIVFCFRFFCGSVAIYGTRSGAGNCDDGNPKILFAFVIGSLRRN